MTDRYRVAPYRSKPTNQPVKIARSTCQSSLLKIDNFQAVFNRDGSQQIEREPMLLIKMICPSTGHIHILRVPPEMESAEAAIT